MSIAVSVVWKTLEWALVAAAVLVYVEIGPGGEALGSVVHTFKNLLLQVDWSSLTSTVMQEIEQLMYQLLAAMGQGKG